MNQLDNSSKIIHLDGNSEMKMSALTKIEISLKEKVRKLFTIKNFNLVETELDTLFLMSSNGEVLKKWENSMTQVENILFFEKHQ